MTLMMNERTMRLVALFALVLSTPSMPQQFEISRSTIDGGSAMRIAGGPFELSGTIGQADSGVMTEGPFELSGGFWFSYDPGDCNEDGKTGLRDYAGLSDCLAGPLASVTAHCRCYDLDKNDTIDLADIAEFWVRVNSE